MTDRVPLYPLEALLERLQKLPKDAQISFSGLTFHRIKQRGEGIFQIEFNEGLSRSADGVLTVAYPEPHTE